LEGKYTAFFEYTSVKNKMLRKTDCSAIFVKMRKLPFFFMLFTVQLLWSQNVDETKPEKNLIPNGSFENFRRKSGNIRQAIPWQDKGTADFYQKPLSNDTTAQKGARSGNCYAGLRFQKKYREFLQVRLAEPLHRGTVYEFSMQVRLAFWSNAVLRSFSILFTKGGYNNPADAIKSSMIDTLVQKGGLHNRFLWFEIKGFYKASGGEKYITLGDFAPSIKKDMARMNLFRLGFKESYYFIDDIKLIKAKQFEEKVLVEIVGPNYRDSALQVKKDIQVGEKVDLKNIFFENGHYYLLPESFVELNKLSEYLLRNPEVQIQINGHSDNVGLKFKNQKMSELRAREVFEYLIKKGVQNKMYFKGFGSSQPIADNDNDIGRAKNRRVEFEVVKK
jgi:outer membrane protein OmpA-like peptidoglycan-associated protein